MYQRRSLGSLGASNSAPSLVSLISQITPPPAPVQTSTPQPTMKKSDFSVAMPAQLTPDTAEEFLHAAVFNSNWDAVANWYAVTIGDRMAQFGQDQLHYWDIAVKNLADYNYGVGLDGNRYYFPFSDDDWAGMVHKVIPKYMIADLGKYVGFGIDQPWTEQHLADVLYSEYQRVVGQGWDGSEFKFATMAGVRNDQKNLPPATSSNGHSPFGALEVGWRQEAPSSGVWKVGEAIVAAVAIYFTAGWAATYFGAAGSAGAAGAAGAAGGAADAAGAAAAVGSGLVDIAAPTVASLGLDTAVGSGALALGAGSGAALASAAGAAVDTLDEVVVTGAMPTAAGGLSLATLAPPVLAAGAGAEVLQEFNPTVQKQPLPDSSGNSVLSSVGSALSDTAQAAKVAGGLVSTYGTIMSLTAKPHSALTANPSTGGAVVAPKPATVNASVWLLGAVALGALLLGTGGGGGGSKKSGRSTRKAMRGK